MQFGFLIAPQQRNCWSDVLAVGAGVSCGAGKPDRRFPRWLAILAALLAGLLFAAPASAAITFTLGTGNPGTNTQKLLIDSNSCTTAGPKSAFVGGRITNTGSAAVTGITATMAGLTSTIYFTGGQTSTQSLGALGAGESVGVYWFVGYNCVEGAVATPTISFTSSVGSQSSTVNLQTYKAISSNAGGLVTSTVLDPGAVVGQIVDITVSYSFGGTSAGMNSICSQRATSHSTRPASG